MRAIALSAVALAICGTLGQADTHADVVDLFAEMASALSDDNAAGFMKAFDRHLPEYESLKSQITAMLQNSEVANSVEPLNDEGDESKRSVDLDWYLELRSRVAAGPLVRRREVLHCGLEKQGRHWRIVALKPMGFFEAPKY